jgi:kynurenine formamidase
LIDVSHTVEHGMVTYKGLPAPLICDYLSREASRSRYSPGTEFQIGRIDMVANTGTYVDSPFHRYADGCDLADLPLSSLANLECLVVRPEPGAGSRIERLPLDAREVRGRAVLVGIDSFNIDSTSTGERPVHSALLGHNIPIVEHLRGLDALPERGARFFAVPVKVRGFGTFPVRAFAIA